jgi:hypothetical protein
MHGMLKFSPLMTSLEGRKENDEKKMKKKEGMLKFSPCETWSKKKEEKRKY